jgi:hypothetical protein
MKKTKSTKLTNLVNRPSTYAKRTYIQKVASTNKRLRTGDIAMVASNTGYSSTHVSDVLSGKEFNDRIVNYAFNMTRGRIQNARKISQLA